MERMKGTKIIVSTKEKDRAGFHTKEFFNCESKCTFIQYFTLEKKREKKKKKIR